MTAQPHLTSRVCRRAGSAERAVPLPGAGVGAASRCVLASMPVVLAPIDRGYSSSSSAPASRAVARATSRASAGRKRPPGGFGRP